MPTIKDIVNELQWLSERISTQVRTLGISLIAIAWGILIGQPEIAGSIPDALKKSLLIVGILALGAMVCDFLQYFFAYLNNHRMLRKMENEKLAEAYYNYGAILYRMRGFFFWFKQILLVVACIWFFAAIIPFGIGVITKASS